MSPKISTVAPSPSTSNIHICTFQFWALVALKSLSWQSYKKKWKSRTKDRLKPITITMTCNVTKELKKNIITLHDEFLGHISKDLGAKHFNSHSILPNQASYRSFYFLRFFYLYIIKSFIQRENPYKGWL